MKNWIFLLLAVTSLSATPKAVVFDWGNVIASPNRSVVIKFLCEELDLTDEEFENVNMKKRIAVQAGKSEVEFWMDFAQQKGIALPADWPFSYIANLKKSVGVDAEVLALIEELKQKEIRVGLLSNIDGHYTKFLRDLGFYDPFDPCLLSSEIGVQKPDSKAYETLLQVIALPAEEIVFIDDKLENVEAAQKMGIDAIQFKSAAQIRQELAYRNLILSNSHEH